MNLSEKPSKQDSQTAKVPTDAELLQKYIDHHDPEAMRELIEKHSSLVMSVCYQTLRNRHDAEDAFQQAFFTLATKANTIKNQSSLSSWLYSVAQRESIQILRSKHRELIKPLSEASSMSNKQEPEIDFDELSILHEELKQIPEKYHAPLILCYLEHKTSQEAAYELDITVASVKASLETGRKLLKKRLRRRGLGLASVLTVWQTAQAHSAEWATTTLLQKTVSACIAKTALTTASASATVSSATTISTKQLLIKGATWMAISTGQKTIISVIAILLLIGGGTLTALWMKNPPENIPDNKSAPIKNNIATGPHQNNAAGNPNAANKEVIYKKCMKKTKELALLIHFYHYLFGQFPPAIVTGPDGKTVHSWRVELLPIVDNITKGLDPRTLSKDELRAEYNELIKESGYDLSKPWDSPENAGFLDSVPECFRHPAAPSNSNLSAYLAITGPGTAFDKEPATTDSVAPGMLMIVTSKNDHPWTKPVDLVYGGDKPIQVGGFGFGGGFGLTAEGATHFLPPEKLAKLLKHFHPPGTVINGPQNPNSQSN